MTELRTSGQGRSGGRHGFTLIELFIVMVIISILAAISIPLLLRQRMVANESSAISSVRTLVSMEAVFKEQNLRDDNGDGISDYATLDELHDPPGGGEPFIDDALGAGTKAGYLFDIEVFPGSEGNSPRYSVFAFPAVYDRTGTRNFYADQEGVIRFNEGEAGQDTIGPDSPPVN